jgi:hypothetical protein
MDEEKCMVLVDGKPCGLPVTPIDKALGKESNVHQCPLGHRSRLLFGRNKTDLPKSH